MVDLDPIEARLLATTPGRWVPFDPQADWRVPPPAGVIVIGTILDGDGNYLRRDDCAFTAHAHDDVRALIAEVRGHRAFRARIEAVVDEAHRHSDAGSAVLDEIQSALREVGER